MISLSLMTVRLFRQLKPAEMNPTLCFKPVTCSCLEGRRYRSEVQILAGLPVTSSEKPVKD